MTACEEFFAPREAVAQQGPESFEGVAGANLFAFFDASPVVADGDFANAVAETAEFSSNFRTKFKTATFKAQLPDQRRAKGLVGRGFVGEACRVENVCGRGEDAIGDAI